MPPSSWRKWPAPSTVTWRWPAAPGTCSCRTSAQPRVAGSPSENAVRKGASKAASARMVRRFRRAHSLAGVRPISSGSWRGPAQKVSSGNGRVVGRQDRVRHLPLGGPLHEQARAERRELLGEALVVEQHLRHGDGAVRSGVAGPFQPSRQCGIGRVQHRVGGHDPADEPGPARRARPSRWARPSPGRRGSGRRGRRGR